MRNIKVRFKDEKLILTIDTSDEGELSKSKFAKIIASSGKGFQTIKNEDNGEEYGLILTLTQRVKKETDKKEVAKTTRKTAKNKDEDDDEKQSKKDRKVKTKKKTKN